VVLVLAGAMNPVVMIAVAAAVLIEKNWRHGQVFSYALGVSVIAFALLVPAHAGLVPAIEPTDSMTSM
jgi:predicted metal-binding membrane protein